MAGWQRRMAAGLLALGTFAGIGGTAGASEKTDDWNYRYEYTLTQIDNPCTPQSDDITLRAEFHTVGKTWRYDDGSYWYHGSNRGHLSGSAADGTGYVGGVQFRAQTRVDDGVVDIVAAEKHMRSRVSDAPNVARRYKLHVQFAVDGSWSSMEILKEGEDCRG
jgi:hypothetical protein